MAIVLALAGCHFSNFAGTLESQSGARRLETSEARILRVAGQTLVYRFPSGRTYQAAYGCEQIRFELLVPKRSPAPSKTMPFTARTIRAGIDLVVWEDPEFYTTFIVDFEHEVLYASALVGSGSPFLGEAEIAEVRVTHDAKGEALNCDSAQRDGDE